jgi:DNA-binding CsgD family transcriptional regulator
MTPLAALMDDTMNSHLLFPQIGKVIASTGSRSFPRMLHELIRTQLAVDALQIRQLQLACEAHLQERSRSAANDAIDARELTWPGEVLYDQGSQQPATARPAHAPEQARVDANRAQMHLSSRRDGYRYVISLYRAQPCASFSPQENTFLLDFSSLLLPMVEQHISALQPASAAAKPTSPETPKAQGLESLHQRFVERLEQCDLTLSNRELEVCVGLLAGRTVPELAEQLRLKANTVESYLKRAAIKLGISGRHSLLRWMYGSDDATAPCSLLGLV